MSKFKPPKKEGKCLQCGKPIVGAFRKYCNNICRQEFYKASGVLNKPPITKGIGHDGCGPL